MKCEKCGKQTGDERDLCVGCHAEHCDECFCQCPAKQELWRRAKGNLFAEMMAPKPCGCEEK